MTRCVIGTREHEAHVGYLCDNHLQKLSAMLREIEDQAALLDAVPSLQQRNGNRGGSLASHRAPARLDVLVHTDRRRGTGKSEDEEDALAAGNTLPILDVLHSWARIIREERGLTVDGAVTIVGERAFLTRHLEWAAEQLWIDEAYDDIRKLAGQLKAVNGTAADKPVGRCYLPADDGACDGPVWMDIAYGEARCGGCGSTWTGPQLAMLSFELEEQRREAERPRTDDGRRMLTADELVSQGYASTISNVRVTAHRQSKVSVDGHYDPEWFTRKVTA